MTDDKTAPSSPTYDSQMNDIYAPAPAKDLSHLVGIDAHVRDTGVVTDKDYDLQQAAPRAPASTPNAPAVTPAATPLDFSTARTSTGQRVSDPALATAETIVTFNGMETTLGALMALGEVTRDATGQYVTTSPDGTQDGTQVDAPPQSAPLDERSEAIMADALSKAPAQVVGAATSLIEGDGVIGDEAVAQVAANMGLDPAVARERINHVTAAYSAEAAQLGAKAAGCSVEVAAEALNWARQEMGSDIRETAQRHFSEGSAAVDYKPYVEAYLATLDHRDPNRILNASPVPGRTVRWDPWAKGIVVTLADGTTMSWSAAVRGRFITLK